MDRDESNRRVGLLSPLLRHPRKMRTFLAVSFGLLLAAVALQSAFFWHEGRREALRSASAQQLLNAKLAAAVIAERFDRLSDTALALSTRVRMRQLAAVGDWEGSIAILQQVPDDFPFVERVVLADTAGVLRADTPAIPGVRGQDFSHRDWYQGVSREWKPYVSDVYQRQAEPRIEVIAVAAPVKAEDGTVVGILMLQIPLDRLHAWSREFDFGGEAVAYFVDRKGAPASGSAPDADVVLRPEVRRVLGGEAGVISDAGRLVAFAPVSPFGWGVIVERPASAVYAAVRRMTASILVVRGAFMAIYLLFAAVLLKVIGELDAAYRRERYLTAHLGSDAVETKKGGSGFG